MKPQAEEIRKMVRKIKMKKRQTGEASAEPPKPKRIRVGPSSADQAEEVPTAAVVPLRSLQISSDEAEVAPVAPPPPQTENSPPSPLPSPTPASGPSQAAETAWPTSARGEAGPSGEGSQRGPSAFHDPDVAMAALRNSLLPSDVEEVRGMSAMAFSRSMFPAMAWLTHCIFATQSSLNMQAEVYKNWGEHVKTAVAEKEVAEELLKATEEKLEKMAREKLAIESKAVLLAAELENKTSRVKEVEADLASKMADFAEEKEELKTQLASRTLEVDRLIFQSGRSERMIAGLNKQLKGLEDKIQSAAADGVRIYKESQDFTDEVMEASSEVYLVGFNDCREAVSKAFPELDLSSIQSIAEAESAEEEDANPEPSATEVIDSVLADVQAEQVPGSRTDGAPSPAINPAPAVPWETGRIDEDLRTFSRAVFEEGVEEAVARMQAEDRRQERAAQATSQAMEKPVEKKMPES